LREDKEEIQAGYSENLRRNIKKDLQLGLYVKQIQNEEDIRKLGVVFDKLYQWRKVKSQWHDSPTAFPAWHNAVELSKKVVWFGVFDSQDKLLGGIMMVNQSDTLFYQLGASDPEKRNLPVLHLCFHKAIMYAKENDFSFFDFGGYDTEANENDQTNNINQFKKQYGGQLISSNPNILVTLNKPVKFLLNFLMNFRNQ
jgi:lipid II:glycine glycyltransferase (peptidoglycan interpeptide bridge formation enzyme)